MKRALLIWVLVLFSVVSFGREYGDSAMYQGVSVKLDLGNTVVALATSKGHVMSYEVAINANLKRRYFPTLEGGYAQAVCTANGGQFFGRGGFARIGVDVSMLKKGKRNNHLMVGVRIGTGMQNFALSNIHLSDGYWQSSSEVAYSKRFRCDAWGEIVAGVQVQVYKAFHMGWYGRFKILMTRGSDGDILPYYIPGFGYKDDTTFSFNYYIGFSL